MEESVISKMSKTYFVYIIRCQDRSLYTGYTTDIKKRFEAHESGNGAKYTRAHKPVEVVYVEGYNSKSIAMSREYKIKALSKQQKEQIIEEYLNAREIYKNLGFNIHTRPVSKIYRYFN